MPRDETDKQGPSPRGTPRILVIGGGRGGVGKSLLSVNLGVYLAQLGRSVVVADVDPAGADLHTVLGLDVAPLAPRDADPDVELEPVATPVPGLRLLPASYDPSAASLRPSKKARFIAQLRRISADYILLDLGATASQAALDLFILADVGVCMAVPEPQAIEATYRFLRALYIRRLRRALAKERFKLRLVERAMKDLPALPNPPEIVAAIAKLDLPLADVAASELSRMHPRLAVNQTRVRTDLDVGPSMRVMAGRYLGIDLDYLGHIEHDDAVWLTVRRRRPLLIDSPTSKSARNVERIARRVLAVVATRDARGPERATGRASRPAMTLYETLGVTRGASDEEVRRAYKRQRELYAQGSLPLTSLVWGDELAREQAKIEEAHDTLLDPVRRRAYDLSTFAETEAKDEPEKPGADLGMAAELLMLQTELAREINAETQFTGALLRKVRESQGIELGDISTRTKIAAAHLRAIEDEAFAELPALVYTRGFVQELAKLLKLDPSQVARTYLSRMREALAASGRTLV